MPSPEALGEAEAPAAGPIGSASSGWMTRREAAVEPSPERSEPGGGHFSLAFHSRLANMGEEKKWRRITTVFHFWQGGEEEKWAGNR